ncbi:MAG: TatD family hydrolase [Clostridia bacterium]|nr:TatD family hydrolase [Clostridia bacterium]
MLIDIHCHLTGDDYDSVGGVQEAVQRALREGVGLLVCSGYDIPSSVQAKALAEAFDEVYFCAGFHPSELKKYQDGDFETLKALFRHEKCVAVGEIGFDFHFENNPSRETQREFFLKQLNLADEAGLPVVIHSRDAAQETLEFLREHRALLKKGGLMHCYSYSPEMLPLFAELGLSFSFGGPSTFKNAKKVCDSVALTPVERILTETDCPYLTPAPYRGVFPNEPKNVRLVAERLAQLRNQDLEEFKKQVEANAKRLFFKVK